MQNYRRSTRPNKGIEPVRLIEELNTITTETVSKDPISFDEVMHGPNARQQKCAMDEEMESLRATGTWKVTKLPPESNAIGCKWVYKI